ncbi:MAG: hypothetical protein AAF754_18930 [Pseudomonadota bacterium]
MKLFIALALALLLAPPVVAQQAADVSENAPVIAETPLPDVVVGMGISTLGANIEAAYRLNPTYRVRGIVMGGVDIAYDAEDASGDFVGDVVLGGVAIMGDFFPLQSGWRLSGGLFLSNAELRATGTAEVEGGGTVDADIDARFASEIAPMVTTGYDIGFGRGWSLNTEAGVIFTGGIDVTYTAEDPALQDALDSDADVQDVVESAADLPIYPYASLTVSFQF